MKETILTDPNNSPPPGPAPASLHYIDLQRFRKLYPWGGDNFRRVKYSVPGRIM